MEANAAVIQGLDRERPMLPQFDLLTDEQMREMARSMDPLARDYFGGSWEYVAKQMKRDGNVHATQELHRRAWKKLKELVRPKLGGALDED